MKVTIRYNALAMLLMAVALVVFVIIVVDRPSTELIIALVAPIVGGAMIVVDKLCTPEAAEAPEDPLVSLLRECFAKLPPMSDADTSDAAHAADRSRHPPPRA